MQSGFVEKLPCDLTRDEKLLKVIRCDTGEVVRSRPMTVSERQDSLPFSTEEAPSAQQ